jgi:hypothetical protein
MTKFEMNDKDLQRFIGWAVKAPRRARGAAGMMLNEFAFGTRDKAIKFWRSDQITRNKRFVESRLRAKKTRLSLPISQMVSSTFSQDAPRFSGWEEQETGKKTQRKRIGTIKGRSGSRKRRIGKRARFNQKIRSPRDMGTTSAHIKSDHHAAQVMLVWARRNLGREPFLIYGHNSMRPGLFRFNGNKLHRLQFIGGDNLQPRQNKWMTKSRERYFRQADLDRIWSGIVDRQLTFR